MTTNFDKILEYNTLYELTTYTTHNYDILNDSMAYGRIQLLIDEYDFANAAYLENNYLNFIKGLGNIIYLVYLFGPLMGTDMNYLFEVFFKDLAPTSMYNQISTSLSNYQRSNIAKQLVDKDFIMPENIVFTEVASIRRTFLKITRNVKILCNNDNKNINNEQKFQNMNVFLCKILYCAYTIGSLLSINMDDIVAIIHEANKQKFINDEIQALQAVNHYKNLLNNNNITFKIVNSKYVIYDPTTEIIYKPLNFVEPDLSAYALN